MLRNIDTITRLIGRRPVGWYNRAPKPEHAALGRETGGFLYDSDAYNDDLPYWTEVSGCRHVIVPYSFDTNDSRLQRGGDFSTGDDFFTYCRDAFDWLYRMGAEGRPRIDEHRSARPDHRAPRPDRRVGAAARAHPASRRRLAVQSGSHREHWIAHHAKS